MGTSKIVFQLERSLLAHPKFYHLCCFGYLQMNKRSSYNLNLPWKGCSLKENVSKNAALARDVSLFEFEHNCHGIFNLKVELQRYLHILGKICCY